MFGTMVQAEPSQCRIRVLGSLRLVGCCVPTAHTSFEETAATPARLLSTSIPMLDQSRAQRALGVIRNADRPNIILRESGDAVQFVHLPGSIRAGDNLPSGTARRLQTKQYQT